MPPEGVSGPHPLDEGRIDELNRVFSDAFTDRYHRDGMTGVRVPRLAEPVWRYAIGAAGEGACCWLDDAGMLAAFNLVHASGSEGCASGRKAGGGAPVHQRSQSRSRNVFANAMKCGACRSSELQVQ